MITPAVAVLRSTYKAGNLRDVHLDHADLRELRPPGMRLGYGTLVGRVGSSNAIGESKFWNSTAIFVFWDDYGGYYCIGSAGVTSTTTDLGLRVPLLVISPYAKKGWVSHVHCGHRQHPKVRRRSL